MKLTENQKHRLIEVIAKKNQVSEDFVGKLFKYIAAKKLAKDPEIKKQFAKLDKVTKDMKDLVDSNIKSGKLKDTPELRKLQKSLGID